jgi:ubiquinol-cytochrome c reductase cytochrome c subunit
MRFSVRKLSTRRRHPLAGFVVLMMGLVVAGGLYAAFAPRPADAQEASARDVEAGRQLFLIGCASCHGKNAEGILTKRDNNYGPTLVGVGAAAVDFQVGTGRMPLAQAGPQAPRKDPEYTAAETRQLAAYVASLAPGPAIPDSEYTDYSKTTVQQLREGGEFFRTNCTACHNSVGAGGALPGGRYAPSLVGVSAKHIYEAMVTGPQNMPVFNDKNISPKEKADIITYLKYLDKNPSPGGFDLGNIGPVAEGLFIWIFGLGAVVGVTIWITARAN